MERTSDMAGRGLFVPREVAGNLVSYLVVGFSGTIISRPVIAHLAAFRVPPAAQSAALDGSLVRGLRDAHRPGR